MKKHFNLRLFFDGEGTAPGGAEGEANNANYDGVADQEPEVIYGKREEPREEPQNDDTNEEGRQTCRLMITAPCFAMPTS